MTRTLFLRTTLIWCIILCAISVSLSSCQNASRQIDNILNEQIDNIKRHIGKSPNYNVKLYEKAIVITVPWYEPISYSAVAWPDCDIETVLKEAFNTLNKVPRNRNIKIYISFYEHITDKYGNKAVKYSLYDLLTVNTNEVAKYRNYTYFEQEYNIEGKIRTLHNFSPIEETITPIK